MSQNVYRLTCVVVNNPANVCRTWLVYFPSPISKDNKWKGPTTAYARNSVPSERRREVARNKLSTLLYLAPHFRVDLALRRKRDVTSDKPTRVSNYEGNLWPLLPVFPGLVNVCRLITTAHSDIVCLQNH